MPKYFVRFAYDVHGRDSFGDYKNETVNESAIIELDNEPDDIYDVMDYIQRTELGHRSHRPSASDIDIIAMNRL